MRSLTMMAPLHAHAAADTRRGDAANGQVAEIVTFRLQEGTSPTQFSQAADGMKPFLQSTGAMISRTLSADADGLWTDHIVWTSMAAAKSAASEVMSRAEAAPFMALIDPTSVSMRHAPVHYRLAQE